MENLKWKKDKSFGMWWHTEHEYVIHAPNTPSNPNTSHYRLVLGGHTLRFRRLANAKAVATLMEHG